MVDETDVAQAKVAIQAQEAQIAEAQKAQEQAQERAMSQQVLRSQEGISGLIQRQTQQAQLGESAQQIQQAKEQLTPYKQQISQAQQALSGNDRENFNIALRYYLNKGEQGAYLVKMETKPVREYYNQLVKYGQDAVEAKVAEKISSADLPIMSIPNKVSVFVPGISPPPMSTTNPIQQLAINQQYGFKDVTPNFSTFQTLTTDSFPKKETISNFGVIPFQTNVQLQPYITRTQTGTITDTETGRLVPVYSQAIYIDPTVMGKQYERPATEEEAKTFKQSMSIETGSTKSGSKTIRKLKEVISILGKDVYQANVESGKNLENLGLSNKNIEKVSNIVANQIAPFGKGKETISNIFSTTIENIRSKPLTNVAIFGLSYGAGTVVKGLPILAESLIPSTRIASGTASFIKGAELGTGLGLGTTAVVVGVPKVLASSSEKELGQNLGNIAAPALVAGFGFTKGSRFIEGKIGGNVILRTPIGEEVTTFKGTIFDNGKSILPVKVTSTTTTPDTLVVENTPIRNYFNLKPRRVYIQGGQEYTSSVEGVVNREGLSRTRLSILRTSAKNPTLRTAQEVKGSSQEVTFENIKKLTPEQRNVANKFFQQTGMDLSSNKAKLFTTEAIAQKGTPIAGNVNFRLIKASSSGGEARVLTRPPTVTETPRTIGFADVKKVSQVNVLQGENVDVYKQVPESELYLVRTAGKETKSLFPKASGKVSTAEGVIEVRKIANLETETNFIKGKGAKAKPQTVLSNEKLVAQAVAKIKPNVPTPSVSSSGGTVLTPDQTSYTGAGGLTDTYSSSKSGFRYEGGYKEDIINIGVRTGERGILSPPKIKETITTIPNSKLQEINKPSIKIETTQITNEGLMNANIIQPTFRIDSVTRTLQNEEQANGSISKLNQSQISREDLLLAQPTITTQKTEYGSPPTPPPKTPFLLLPSSSDNSTLKSAFRKLSKGYKTFIKTRGKKVYLSGITTKGEAIKKGERVALGSLVATFGIEEAGAIRTSGFETNYKPSDTIFRNFAIRGKSRIQLKDTWIQKAGTRKEGVTIRGARLASIGERKELSGFRRSRTKRRFFK